VREPKAVSLARHYAELHLRDKMTLAKVASHVALSADHFSRLFSRTAGIAFGEYVNCRRIAHARRLLNEPAQRVSEISYACGFDSVPHFNRVFRRIAGTSPTTYRRQNGRCEIAPGPVIPTQLQIAG
jgi:AraC-like DNA-binding protein